MGTNIVVGDEVIGLIFVFILLEFIVIFFIRVDEVVIIGCRVCCSVCFVVILYCFECRVEVELFLGC